MNLEQQYEEAITQAAPTHSQKEENNWASEFVRRFYVYDLENATPAGAEKKAVAFIQSTIHTEVNKDLEEVCDKLEGMKEEEPVRLSGRLKGKVDPTAPSVIEVRRHNKTLESVQTLIQQQTVSAPTPPVSEN